jgi:uncharacterized protein (DUF697 family)
MHPENHDVNNFKERIDLTMENGSSSEKHDDIRTAVAMGLTREEREKCGSIIHQASGAAALVGSGMAQIPLSDAVLIAPIQIKMITAIGSVFDVDLTESAAKGLFAALSASCVGRVASQLLVGWIPIVGNLVNACTAAGLTEAMGWLAVEHFNADTEKVSFKEAILRRFGLDKTLSESKEKLENVCEKTNNISAESLADMEEQLEG